LNTLVGIVALEVGRVNLVHNTPPSVALASLVSVSGTLPVFAPVSNGAILPR
jgi:hypothetical protein